MRPSPGQTVTLTATVTVTLTLTLTVTVTVTVTDGTLIAPRLRQGATRASTPSTWAAPTPHRARSVRTART
ncbi:hypothetical protein ACFUJR_23505 [Streptomyces sp. NPDC057271]|uniref:hypothetical protein n=1 Tax=Streptomyces sp. NPDC057271 TaxID=3346078 RepID=UPI003631DDFA